VAATLAEVPRAAVQPAGAMPRGASATACLIRGVETGRFARRARN